MPEKNKKISIRLFTKLGNIDTEIGTLSMFNLSTKASLDLDVHLNEHLGKVIDDIEPEKYIRALIMFTCYPSSTINQDGTKPDGYPLSNDEIGKLSDATLKCIAEHFLKHRLSIPKSSEPIDSFEELDTIEKLHKLHILDKKERVKSNKRMLEHIKQASTSAFSEPLQTQFAGVSLAGNSLQKQIDALSKPFESLYSKNSAGVEAAIKANQSILAHESLSSSTMEAELARINKIATQGKTTMDALDFASKGKAFFPEPKIPEQMILDWTKEHQRKEEVRREPFNELGGKLDKLVDVSAQSVRYMNQMNDAQRQSAEETKRSSDDASRNSMWTIILTFISIVIAGLGVWISWMGMTNSSSLDEQKAYYEEQLRLQKSEAEALQKMLKLQREKLNSIEKKENQATEQPKKEVLSTNKPDV